MNKNILMFLMTALLLCFCPQGIAYAAEKIVIITVNTSTMEDFLSVQGLRKTADEGVLGLMNSKSVNRNNQYKPYLTIGTGERSDVYSDSVEAVRIDKYNKKAYEQFTLHPAKDGEIANMWINRIKEINSKTYYNAHPGKLGDILKSNNKKTGFIGGFWEDNSIKSPAFFICMDSFGLADLGETSKVFDEGTFDYDAVFNAYSNIKDNTDFIVIELGELESLYSQKKLYNNDSYNICKSAILKRCSALIDRIKDNMDFSSSLLIIMSPYSYDVREQNSEVLSPIILYDGGKSRGILTSKTTRREGVISSIDIAPSVLSYFKIKGNGFKGYPLSLASSSNKIEYISRLNGDTKAVSYSRPLILKSFATLIIITLAVYGTMLLSSTWFKYSSIICFIMMIFMYIPFSMLIEGLFRFQSVFSKAAFIIVIGSVMASVTYLIFKNSKDRVLFMSALNVLILILDLISGQNMQRYSVMSYDPIIGARYYGMGNEYLGVIISCSLITCSLLKYKWDHKRFHILILSFIAIVIGLPWLGSNVGGLIASAFSFFFFIMIYREVSVGKAIISGIVWAAVSVTVVLAFNLISGGFESHLGNMVHRIGDSGFTYAVNILYRKVSMGMKLIRYTIWSKVLIALIVTSLILFLKPGRRKMDTAFFIVPVKKLWITTIFTCCTAILFNDSGIVTAAIIMLYVVLSTVLMFQRE